MCFLADPLQWCCEQEKIVAALQSEISELRSKAASPVAQQRRRLVTALERLSGSHGLQIVNVPLHDPSNELEIQKRVESKLLRNLERKYERAEAEVAGLPLAVRGVVQKLQESHPNLLQQCEQIESLIKAQFEDREAKSNGFVARKFDSDWVRVRKNRSAAARECVGIENWLQFQKDLTYAEDLIDLFAPDETSWNDRVDLEALVPKAEIPYSGQAQKAIREKKEEFSEAREETKRVMRRILNLYQGVSRDQNETGRQDQALEDLECRHQQEVKAALDNINGMQKRLFDDIRAKSVQLRDAHREALNKARSNAKRDVDQIAQAEVQRQAQATEKYCWTLLQDAPVPTWSLPGYVIYSSGKPRGRSQQSKPEDKPERNEKTMFKFTDLHPNGRHGEDIRIEGRPPNALVCVESGRFRGKNGPLINYDATSGRYTARIGSVVGEGVVPRSQRQALAQYLWGGAQSGSMSHSGIHDAAAATADHIPRILSVSDNFKGLVGQPAAGSYTAVRSRELVDALIQEHAQLVPVACKAFEGRNLMEECNRRVRASLDSDAPTLGMLVLVDPRTGAVITHDAIESLQNDPGGEFFPWHYSAGQKAEWAAEERAAVAAAELQAEQKRAYQVAQRVKAEMVRACVLASRLRIHSLRVAFLFFHLSLCARARERVFPAHPAVVNDCGMRVCRNGATTNAHGTTASSTRLIIGTSAGQKSNGAQKNRGRGALQAILTLCRKHRSSYASACWLLSVG